jgi:spore germination protein YaaH
VLPDEPRALEQAAEHGARRDPASGVPWYSYRDADGWWQGWFEDAESLRAKYDFVRSRGLGGIAIFPLAYGTEEVWSDVRRALR